MNIKYYYVSDRKAQVFLTWLRTKCPLNAGPMINGVIVGNIKILTDFFSLASCMETNVIIF